MILPCGIRNATVNIGNTGITTASMVAQGELEEWLNQKVTIQLDNGNTFTGIVVQGSNNSKSNTCSISAESIVSILLQRPFRGITSKQTPELDTISNTLAYNGSYAEYEPTTGEVIQLGVSDLISKIVNSATNGNNYNEQIQVEVAGTVANKVDRLDWNGETAKQLIDKILANEFDVNYYAINSTLYISGITDEIRYISEYEDFQYSVDLRNSYSSVIIESPDIQNEIILGGNILVSTNRIAGFSRMATSFDTNKIDLTNADNYTIDKTNSLLRYKNTGTSTPTINVGGYAIDKRITRQALTQNDFEWEQAQVIVDEDLGKCEDGAFTTAEFDRTSDMQELARSMADMLGGIVAIGTLQIRSNIKINVGDVLTIIGKPYIITVKNVEQSAHNNIQKLSVGEDKTGNYEELKNRNNLNKIVDDIKEKVVEAKAPKLSKLIQNVRFGQKQGRTEKKEIKKDEDQKPNKTEDS